MSHEKPPNLRPENLVKSIFGSAPEGLTEDEQAMREMLTRRFKDQGKALLGEVKRWREAHPDASYGDAIRALYQIEEEAEMKE